MISELRHRDPLLFWTGVAMLLTLIVVTLLSISDTRLILGINPWIKPMKFLTSIAIFVWTIAWFMPESRPSAVIRWTIALSMTIEIVCIIMQAARGTTSHYNNATPFDAIVFAVMGVTIMINTFAVAWFLWLVRRDTPASRAGYLWGVRLGLAIFLLASLEGLMLVANGAHTVGAPDGGAGLPIVNWSTQHGDLRIAHFFGMHAMQALPLIGFLSNSRNLVFGVSIIWVAILSGLIVMALQGLPLIAI